MEGCEAVLHLVGIIEEFLSRGITFEALHVEATRNVVAEARRAGIERFVHMSANGAATDGVSRYYRTKWEAEEIVRHAGFTHWTILRPGLVFGEPKPGTTEFCTRLARELIIPFPIVPLFGKGDYVLRPVSVVEVANALIQGLALPEAHGRSIVAVGKKALPYRDVIDCIAHGLGRKSPIKKSLPIGFVRRMLRGLGNRKILPVSRDQFEMLIAGNDGDPEPFYSVFDVEPRPFTAENLSYLRRRA